jgi:hypothetical protein
MTEADIERTVNVRPTWHDYCAEFLGELWWMNIDAFWRHAEVAFRHPEEGMVVGDTDDHWDALKSAPMPQYVWKACLESILATSLVLPELLEETVVAQLDWGGEHGESMRDELVAWVRSRTNVSSAPWRFSNVRLREPFLHGLLTELDNNRRT